MGELTALQVSFTCGVQGKLPDFEQSPAWQQSLHPTPLLLWTPTMQPLLLDTTQTTTVSQMKSHTFHQRSQWCRRTSTT